MTAPPAGALEACLALLEKATPGEWHCAKNGSVVGTKSATGFSRHIAENAWPSHPSGVADMEAIAAAVNLLRTHGPALLAALRLREWRPIADAPKDGSDILASGVNFGQLDQGRHTCLAYWNDTCWKASEGGEFTRHEHLTHWMPLPTPSTADDLARVLEDER